MQIVSMHENRWPEKHTYCDFYMNLASHFCRGGGCRCERGSGRNKDKRADVKQKVGAAACEELI